MDTVVFYRPATPGERATQIDSLISERNALLQALRPLAAIADAYDANELDDDARKHWCVPGTGKWVNEIPPEKIELYAGRGGKRLLTLADCFAARAAILKAETK